MENINVKDDCWHYEKNGSRFGPVSDKEIADKVAKGDLSNETLVWNEGWGSDRNWKQVKETEIIKNIQYSGPPPLPANRIDNSLVWALVGVQIAGTLIEIILQQSIPGFSSLWIYMTIAYFIVNSGLALKDSENIKKSGNNDKIGFWFWLIPVYLYKRAKSLGQNLRYFWAWIGAAFIGMLLVGAAESSDTYLGVGTPACSSSAVTKLAKNVFDDIPAAQSQGIRALSLTNIEEIESDDGSRLCEGDILTLDGGSYFVNYEITDQGDEFYVELEVLR